MNEGLSTKDAKKLNKASALDQSNDPKDQDRARARRTEVDYKDLLRQINSRKKPNKPAVSKMKEQNELAGKWKIDSSAHKKAQKKAKLRNLAKGNTNPNEKAAAEKKAGGPKLMGEGKKKGLDGKECWDGYKLAGTKKKGGKTVDNCVPVKEGKTFDQWKKAAAKALGKKKEERTAQKAMDAGSRLRRKKQRQEYAAKISGSEDNVPDDIRD